MSVVALTKDGLDEAVARHDLLVIELADSTAASLEALADAHPDVGFARAVGDAGQDLRAMFGLTEPGVVIFRERIVLYCEAGMHSGERIAGLLARVRSLDMDTV